MEKQDRIPLSNTVANMRRLTPNVKLQELWQKLEDKGFETLEEILIYLIRHPGKYDSNFSQMAEFTRCHYETRRAFYQQLVDCGWGDNLRCRIAEEMKQEIKNKLKEAEQA